MEYKYSDADLEVGSVFSRWGYKMTWTKDHHTPTEMECMIHRYDVVATEAVAAMDEIAPPPYVMNGAAKPPSDDRDDGEKKKTTRRDYYDLMQEYAEKDEKIGKLWTEINTVPDWVDWEQIERGQKIFWRYGGPCLTTLTFLSLLGGMGNGRVVETLDRTGGFDAKVVRRRLLETTQHTLNVHKDLKSIQPGGDGFTNSVRVRLLHTSVRRRIMAMAAQKPEYYNMDNYGVPINDLDSLGTIMTFCAVPIWLGLPRQGVYLRQQEILDYLALWRYIAYIMGTPHDWLATPESAKLMMESILVSEINPSEASANLANNIITGLKDHPPTYASGDFLRAQTWWLNGKDLSRALDIAKPSPYYFALVLGQTLLFTTLSYINRSFSFIDRHNINAMRNASFAMLLHDKSKGALGYTTRFNFKWVPQYEKLSTDRGTEGHAPAVIKPGVERTALISLLTFTAMFGASVWYGYRALAQVL